MPTPRPTDTPIWATVPSGGSSVDEPPSGLQIRGWIPFNKPPAAFVNWLWNRTSAWSGHFASTASSFPTLEGAANAPAEAPLVVGDSCLINEPDGVLPGVVTVVGMDAILSGSAKRAAGGDGVLYADLFGGITRVRLNERDGSGLIREYTLTNPSTAGIQAVLYDGVDVVAAYTDGITLTLECWNAVTGVSKWVVTPVVGVTAINNLAWDATQIYLVSGLVNAQLKAIDRAAGGTNWTYDNGGTSFQSVATNGFLVFVQGGASTQPSGATLRGIVASNGFDFTGEGGLGTDATFAWNVIETTAGAGTGVTIATDGRTLYTASGIGTPVLELRGCADGLAAITRTLPAQANTMAVDQDQVYIVTTGSVLVGYAKTSLVQAWKQTSVTANVVTDGSALFAGNDRLARGNRPPYIFRRVDPSVETQLPLRQLLVPVSRN